MKNLDHMNTMSKSRARMNVNPWAIGTILLLALGGCQKNEPLDRYGCTDMEYDNYDPDANAPNGSCCRFVDAGSRIWRGTVTDSVYGFMIPYMVARIAGWLEGPCINMDRGAICVVTDDVCGIGPCRIDVPYKELNSFYHPLVREAEAFFILNIDNCCTQSIDMSGSPDPDYITLQTSYFFNNELAYKDTTVNRVNSIGRFGNGTSGQIQHPIPDRAVDSVSVRILNITLRP